MECALINRRQEARGRATTNMTKKTRGTHRQPYKWSFGGREAWPRSFGASGEKWQLCPHSYTTAHRGATVSLRHHFSNPTALAMLCLLHIFLPLLHFINHTDRIPRLLFPAPSSLPAALLLPPGCRAAADPSPSLPPKAPIAGCSSSTPIADCFPPDRGEGGRRPEGRWFLG